MCKISPMKIGPIAFTLVLMVALLAGLACKSPDYPLEGTAWNFEIKGGYTTKGSNTVFFISDGTFIE